jgi:predicted membrane channel-forming protein YqfA (hemolysin III family)
MPRGLASWVRLPALLALSLLVAGCAQVGTQNITFWDIVWSITFFFFWLIFIWMFIALFTDVIRRRDLSGLGKAGWIFFMLILPFIGILAYIVTRPATVPYGGGANSLEATGVSAGPTHSNQAGTGSTTDELERLANLRASGAITEQEFQQLKSSQLGSTKAG